ncbi:hypothetical protein [Syntrophomonas curvata]
MPWRKCCSERNEVRTTAAKHLRKCMARSIAGEVPACADAVWRGCPGAAHPEGYIILHYRMVAVGEQGTILNCLSFDYQGNLKL